MNFLNQQQEFPECKILGRIERNSTFIIICLIFIGLIFKISQTAQKIKEKVKWNKNIPNKQPLM